MIALPIPHRTRRKVVKVWRHLRWSTRGASALPLVWHIGQPNFGDDFNPVLFEKILDHRMRLGRRDALHFLGAGSILHLANRNSVVLGSGFISDSVTVPDACRQIVSVRGERSLQRLKARGDVFLGDPFVLMALYYRQAAQSTPKTMALGFVPHISFFRNPAKFGSLIDGVEIIDLGAGFRSVIEQMSRCRVILSESLHGLIVSDALAIPNIWIKPSASLIGGEFKFSDYYSTTDRAKSPVALAPQLLAQPERFEPFVSNYRYNLSDYEKLFRSSIELRTPQPG